MVRDGVTYRILSDHLGSVPLVVDVATNDVAQRLDYDEYGRIIQDSNPGFQPFGFAGGLYDRQTGLVRFGARDYDPRIGRWTAKDPIRFGGDDSNPYAYSGLDPVNSTDVAGRAQKCSRPLEGPAGSIGDAIGGEGNPRFLEFINIDPYHEHFWFDDGTNFGFYPDGVRPDTHPKEDFRCEGRTLDDTTLGEAIDVLSEESGPYAPFNNNCQDWADRVMEEYERRRLEEVRETGVDPERQFIWNRLLGREGPLWTDDDE
jgi:RHS repeat-associated protein